MVGTVYNLIAMIYLTQLIYIKPGQEAVFNEFESHAIPQIKKYGGSLLLRTRPSEASVIAHETEIPYEIHIVKFESEAALQAYMGDEERKKYLPLKEQSVERSLIFKGLKI